MFSHKALTLAQKFKPFILGFLLICLLIVFVFTRLLYLNSGIQISEPDELSYDITSKSLSNNFVPVYGGRPFLEQSPLYDYLNYFVHYFIRESTYPRTFISIRLVAVVSSLLLGISLFWYLHKKVNLRTAIYGFIFFTITPLTLYYSKVGLREMFLMLIIFWFFIFFDKLVDNARQFRDALFSGVLLGLGIAIKTTALVFATIPLFYSVVSLFEKITLTSRGFDKFHIRFHLSRNWRKYFFPNFLILVVSSLITILVFLPYSLLYPRLFKDRLYLTFFAHGSEGLLNKIKTLSYYFNHLELWLSLTLIILFLLGLVRIIYRRETSFYRVLIFSVPLVFLLLSNEPRARYFLLLTPYLIIIASVGMDFLTTFFNNLTRSWPVSVLVNILIVLLILPKTFIALNSFNHTIIEQGVKILRGNYDNQMVFSTFWPQLVHYTSGLPTARFTDSQDDVARDYKEFPNFSPEIKEPPTDYILKNPSFVLILRPLDKDEFSERKRAVKFVEERFQPLVVISDHKPNFPEKTPPYQIFIYKF